MLFRSGSHVVSPWLSEPATTAVSMAIKRPQAIDAAPVRAGAQRSDGRAATFLYPRGMGEAQGKKVAASPLRQGDRGAALLWPDSVIDETAPSRARRPQGKVMRPWDHARAGVAPRENKKHRRTERRPDTAGPRLAAQCSHQSQWLTMSVPLDRPATGSRSHGRLTGGRCRTATDDEGRKTFSFSGKRRD